MKICIGNPPYAGYDSTLAAAKKMYALLAYECEAVTAITRQDMKFNSLLAVTPAGKEIKQKLLWNTMTTKTMTTIT